MSFPRPIAPAEHLLFSTGVKSGTQHISAQFPTNSFHGFVFAKTQNVRHTAGDLKDADHHLCFLDSPHLLGTGQNLMTQLGLHLSVQRQVVASSLVMHQTYYRTKLRTQPSCCSSLQSITYTLSLLILQL